MRIVDGLLQIKRVRERACEQEVLRVRRLLDDATAALERAVEQRRRRDEERLLQERKMIDELCAAPVRVRDIEWVRVDIDGLKQQAQQDLGEEQQAGERREQVRDEFRGAVKARQHATRATVKFEELAERERIQRNEAAERQADAELEDFRPRLPDPELDVVA